MTLQAVPLNRRINEMTLKSKRSKQMLFAILKTKKLLVNCNLRKMGNKFGKRNHRRTARRQRAKRFCRTTRNQFPKNQTTINIQKRIPTTGILFFCIFTLSELVSEREPVHGCTRLLAAVWCCMFPQCKILSTMS